MARVFQSISRSRLRMADLIMAAITDRIRQQRLSEGDRIGSEQDFIEQFGGSRSVVREALRMLERDGVVTVKPGINGGVFCSSPGIQTLSRQLGLYNASHDVDETNLVDARTELEVLMARLAAERANRADVELLEKLNRCWVDCIRDGDLQGAADVNVEFHAAIAEASHNPVFVAFVEALRDLIYETGLNPQYPERGLDYVVFSHQRILEPIAAGDPEEAARRMREHLETFRPGVTESILEVAERAARVIEGLPTGVSDQTTAARDRFDAEGDQGGVASQRREPS